MSFRSSNDGNPAGPAVDARGVPLDDPTQNVLALVEAAIKRQDDLRELAAKHLKEVADLRAEYGKQLREAESSRIDAIRAVDVGAVTRAAEVSATQAATLATQVQVSAETLRGQVQAAANAQTIALASALEPIQKDIADLRKVQYEQQGARQNVVESKESNAVLVGLGISTVIAIISLIGLIIVLISR